MVNHLIAWSLDNRFVVMLLAVVLLGVGFLAAASLPLDAVPDLTNVQVQVLTTSPALGPVEVEQFITFPVENAMSGLPRVEEIRSISRYGLSAVTVAFEEGTDIYWARNLANERLQMARESIPPGMGDPQLWPIATGMSEIYQFEVRAKPGFEYSLMDLRTILDWQIAYQLRSVPGVIEVNTFGGELKTYEVQLDPDKLLNFGISLGQVFAALEENNGNAGGGAIRRGAEQRLIRAEGLIGSLDDIRNIVLIEALTLDFAAGLSVLTGETGAGKSLLLDALDALLGGAQGGQAARLLRRGSDRGRIEAGFSLSPPVRAWLTWQVTPGTFGSAKASTQTRWLAPSSFQAVVTQPTVSASAGPAVLRASASVASTAAWRAGAGTGRTAAGVFVQWRDFMPRS